jgi:acyl dehydratase
MNERVDIGDTVPAFTRRTDFGHWNRYAAVNDEFIDVHMSRDAAISAGQPDVFGMGNLRVAYVHNALHNWLDGRGDISMFECQFRQLNFLGDELTTSARVTAIDRRDGSTVVDLDIGVVNQRGEETMPGAAQVVLFEGAPRMPAPMEPAAIPARAPGEYLDAATIDWLGRSLEPLRSYPVDANDIRRWAQATYFPEHPPAELADLDVARKGPWGELVAPRDFNPFAWHLDHRPDIYPWMRGMGTEPGYRGLNGGQRSWYFAPIRVGDVITADVMLIDAYEKHGRLGTMMFLIDETRLSNQRGELVRIGHRTSIYH